jgi:ATP-binding cassette subfamily C protein LapB
MQANVASLAGSPPIDGASRAADPLAAALLYLAAFHGRAISHDALTSGLPLEDGRLSASLFSRAAQRAFLECEPVKRPLADIPSLVLPAVLIMRNGSTRVLLALESAGARATVVDPASGDHAHTLPLAEIQQDYLGYAFFVRPAATADARAMSAGDMPRPHWFWSVVSRFWRNYSHVAIAALLVNVLGLAAPLFMMNVYDRVIPNGAIPSLVALSIGMLIAISFEFVLRTVRSRIIDLTGKKIDVVLAANVFEHVLALKLAQRPTSVGVLANQLREFDSVREFFTSGSLVSAIDLLFAILFIGVLFIIAGPLAFIPLVLLPIIIVLGLVIQFPLDRAMRRLQAESAARHGVLIESLTGIETVRATGGEAKMQRAFEKSVAATARSGEDVHFWSALALTSSNAAQQLSTFATMVIGVFLILDGKITVGALIAAVMLGGRVLAPISGLASVITRSTQTFIAMRAIDKIMSLERERSPERSYVARPIKDGSVTFDNVSFRYPNAPENALEKVSFKIAAGERVGIIGRIGSGKTTVGRMLVGFYEPLDGRVLVDGVDARQYDPADLRAGVGFVLQDTDLFFGKLRDNITFGKPTATDEEVLMAARLAGVESFIAGHPLGYDMPIAEGGRSLSGGQKQAIGLARVLIRRPKVLFLDEPTAHFDVRSEAEFLERLKTLADGKMTIIVSTHRLSLLSMVDRLLLFDKGRLVADGPRDKVLALLQGNNDSGGKPPHPAQPQPQPKRQPPQPVHVVVAGGKPGGSV